MTVHSKKGDIWAQRSGSFWKKLNIKSLWNNVVWGAPRCPRSNELKIVNILSPSWSIEAGLVLIWANDKRKAKSQINCENRCPHINILGACIHNCAHSSYLFCHLTRRWYEKLCVDIGLTQPHSRVLFGSRFLDIRKIESYDWLIGCLKKSKSNSPRCSVLPAMGDVLDNLGLTSCLQPILTKTENW